MSIYVISDLHLSFFPGADKPMDVFGARWFNHAQRLEQNWRETVREEDTVVIPGDISWGLKMEDAKYDLDWVDALPGRKIILKGNHDLWWNGITKMNRMYDSIRFLQYDHAEAEGCYICGSRGWLTPDSEDFTADDEKIYRRELLRLESSLSSAREALMKTGADNGEGDAPPIIGFLHFPPVADPRSFSGFQQLFSDYGVKDVYYGHIHGEDAFRNSVQGEYHGINYHLVSLDYLNCRPLLIRQGDGQAESAKEIAE